VSCSYGRRSLFSVRCANPEERQEAIESAAKIESELGSTHPTILKPMLHSHVSGGFWLVSEKIEKHFTCQ
jgi:hypothetical protein